MKNDYIAVFDSGVGGVSVLKALRQALPQERFIYYGDCANAPYGSRSTEEARALTLAAVERILAQYPVKTLVVACNTATAVAIQALREKYQNLIVIGIEPALKLAADKHPGGRIGVMATEVTLREEKFDALLHRFPGCTVEKIPAPGLVELIEAGKADSDESLALLHRLLDPHIGLDALVLGCTHYPFAKAAISQVLGEKTELLDGSLGTAAQTKRRLSEEDLLGDGPGELIIRSSLADEALQKLARQYLI